MQDANLDFAREERCGFGEVVYAEGKSAAQTVEIMGALAERHGVALATRVPESTASALVAAYDDVRVFGRARVAYIDRRESPVEGTDVEQILACPNRSAGNIVVACAGTSDLAVAEEAALTARVMGSRVTLMADVGVAGVHRVLERAGELRAARVIIAVAGMEGALASLVAGLVDVPVIAVPTSVGYGASFGGVSALLGMLNSCAGGVAVVNIDNGFGAAQIAHRINLTAER